MCVRDSATIPSKNRQIFASVRALAGFVNESRAQ